MFYPVAIDGEEIFEDCAVTGSYIQHLRSGSVGQKCGQSTDPETSYGGVTNAAVNYGPGVPGTSPIVVPAVGR